MIFLGITVYSNATFSFPSFLFILLHSVLYCIIPIPIVFISLLCQSAIIIQSISRIYQSRFQRTLSFIHRSILVVEVIRYLPVTIKVQRVTTRCDAMRFNVIQSSPLDVPFTSTSTWTPLNLLHLLHHLFPSFSIL